MNALHEKTLRPHSNKTRIETMKAADWYRDSEFALRPHSNKTRIETVWGC